jgi:hypothetical protein
MFGHKLKRDRWSHLLIATAPSEAQSPSDTQGGRRAQAYTGVENENMTQNRKDSVPSWMSSGVVLTTARAASGM